jgi:hypothetical protein
MAQHKVKMTMPTLDIGKPDVNFEIKVDDSVLGNLKVSKGAIEWVPKHGAKNKTVKRTWSQFHDLMKKELKTN